VDNAELYETVGKALSLLAEGVEPFVEKVFDTVLPAGVTWTAAVEHQDELAGRASVPYNPHDLSLLLRVLTDRLGGLGFPFDRDLPRQGQLYASELRETHRAFTENETFTAQTAYRAADSASLLLRLVGATAEADRVDEIKLPLLPVPVASPAPAVDVAVPSTSPPTALLTITSVPFLSYAMAHCRVPIIDEIVIENQSTEKRGASLEIDVASARGSLGAPKVLMVDLGEGATTTLKTVNLLLDPALMLDVEEQRPGVIRATLRDSLGGVIAESSVDVQILAYNHWIAQPLNLGLELLAAHVQPNASAISTLLLEASDLLNTRTFDSTLSGYQSENPERVDATVEAIYDAMRARDIRYAEPPASWGSTGQKVRTPAEVLEGRLGTCLDTTLTLAAALEQAGINSTLWMLEGHIFLGYWRTDSALESVAHTDVSEIVNRVDLGSIALVETTGVTGGSTSASFAASRRVPHTKYLADGLDKFLGVTDIREARNSHIYPLPSRSVDDEGHITVTQYQPASAVIAPYLSTQRAAPTTEATAVPERVAVWKNSLLDLSLRNKLINYTDRSGYRIEVPAPAVSRMEDAVNAGASIHLLGSDAVPAIYATRGIKFGRDIPEDDRELLLADKKSVYIDVTAASYTSKLRYLANKAKTIVEETGANNLYLAFGMLHWTLNDRELRSPLVLIPVTITTANRGTSFRLTIDESGESTPNYCLLEKLRVSFGLQILGLSAPSEDASGIDLAGTFRAVREAIDQAGLPFRVEESVDLSVLQFAKFRLWKDLDENWETLSQNSLVSHLVHTPLDAYTDPVAATPEVDLDALGGAVPVPADSSQLEAVAEAVEGRTFVLEGPPGTGKSQTITNLLARSLADGKRVLFVAEKRAALDVVKKRLESVGLGAFSLDLHDKGARPNAVRAQIKSALDLHLESDSVTLEMNEETARSSRSSLSRYATRLHSTNAAGLSLYSARAQELAASDSIDALPIPTALVADGTPEVIAGLRTTLRHLAEVSDLARPGAQHPWAFIDEPHGTVLDATTIVDAARQFDGALEAAQAAGFELDTLNRLTTPHMASQWDVLAGAPRYPLAQIDELHSDAWRTYLTAFRADIAAVTAVVPQWATTFAPGVLGRDIPTIHQAALAADDSGFFGRKKKRRAVLATLAADLTVDASTVPLKELSALTATLAASHAAAAQLRASAGKLPMPLVIESWNPFVAEQADTLQRDLSWLEWLGRALNSGDGEHTADLRAYYAASSVGDRQTELHRLADTWQNLDTVTAVDPHLIERWAGETGWMAKWWATRNTRNLDAAKPVTLERWLALVRHLVPLRAAGLISARESILRGQVLADDAALAFDKGIARASIAERADANALGEFDAVAHNKTITRFTSSTRDVRAELPRSIPVDVLALRTFDTNVGAGMFGGLRRQLDRQRGGMSVRALFENYGELITKVMPCTLMSPESVARFFPANADLFDIVVFDEASQIRVADAVGAMGRARSVVVVGDSKQMPPTSFAEVGTSIDEDIETSPETVVDEESILSECVQARVPSKWLSWHYRSQDESLIAFSNYHYYDNRLSSFPAPVTATRTNTDGHGVSMVLIDGHFNRSGRGKTLRINQVEADAIVADIQQRFAASPDESPSVGVITFNAQQRDLVENMLRDSADERIALALDETDGLFVKNLENVQGDERDTILFSIAFSANNKGVVPLNFGPLSRAGGERRLNVAITRARRQVVLFASFAPNALRAQDTSSVGIKHLKAYLEMAAGGGEDTTDALPRQSIIDRHREDVASELRALGYAVHTDVGLSDFRVDITVGSADAPQQPLVAVLLDGPNWRARRTVSDRDGLPVEVLENLMRWPGVERVWLPEWLQDREGTIARLRAAVDTAAASFAAASVASASVAAASVASTAVAPDAVPVAVPVPAPDSAAMSQAPDAQAPETQQPQALPAPTSTASTATAFFVDDGLLDGFDLLEDRATDQ
jgi:hypothetical protein